MKLKLSLGMQLDKRSSSRLSSNWSRNFYSLQMVSGLQFLHSSRDQGDGTIFHFGQGY